MTIFCLGSINLDVFYDVPHLPGPGETILSTGSREGLGGKGANQSVAAAKAGSTVTHIGAVGEDGEGVLSWMTDFGVDTSGVLRIAGTKTAVANVMVDPQGENSIVIMPGANASVRPGYPPISAVVERLLGAAKTGDTLMLQNEVPGHPDLAEDCMHRGMRVVYSAAPFEERAVREMLPHITTLVMNAVEAEQLCAALETDIGDIPVPEILITRGAEGADWHAGGEALHARPVKVTPVDTTGAGDTFIGYFAAGLDQGMAAQDALDWAARAAALMVTRKGTAAAIPTAGEVHAFSGQGA